MANFKEHTTTAANEALGKKGKREDTKGV